MRKNKQYKLIYSQSVEMFSSIVVLRSVLQEIERQKKLFYANIPKKPSSSWQ